MLSLSGARRLRKASLDILAGWLAGWLRGYWVMEKDQAEHLPRCEAIYEPGVYLGSCTISTYRPIESCGCGFGGAYGWICILLLARDEYACIYDE